jgi:transposase-like protein
MRCQANTQAGKRCARRAMHGTELCHAHRGIQVGRPSKLTDELEQKLCDALRAGNYLEVAARYAGVSRSSVHRWIAQAAEDTADPRLKQFAEAVRKAEADAEIHAVGVVRKAINQGDTHAAFGYLERRHPERWRRRGHSAPAAAQAHEATGDLDATDPKTRRLLSELLRHRQTAR